jgi:hypothetical protein
MEPMQQPTPVQQPEPPHRRRSLVGPVILILIGVAFLLKELNLFEFNIWEMALRLWPVWLIALGLDMLVGRRTSYGSWIVLGLVVTIVGGSVWYFSNYGYVGNAEVIQVSQGLEGATRATVEVKAGVGEFRIGATNTEGQLVEGNVYQLPNERITTNAYTTNNEINYVIKSEGIRIGPGFNGGRWDATWDLRLNKQVLMDLRVGTGVGESVMDLEQLNLSNFELNTGVGQTRVTLPAKGQFNVHIKGGIGETVVVIPTGMAARIRATNGIGSIHVNGDFVREGSYYVSRDYDTAANRVDVEVNNGIGALTINQR